MAASQFTDAALRGYLDAGHSQADAARHFGVSEAAIHQRMKRMRRLTSHVIALEKAGAVVDEKLNATARLEHVQRVIDAFAEIHRRTPLQDGEPAELSLAANE